MPAVRRCGWPAAHVHRRRRARAQLSPSTVARLPQTQFCIGLPSVARWQKPWLSHLGTHRPQFLGRRSNYRPPALSYEGGDISAFGPRQNWGSCSLNGQPESVAPIAHIRHGSRASRKRESGRQHGQCWRPYCEAGATDWRRLRRWRLCKWRGGRVRPGPGRSALWCGGQRARQPLVHLVTAPQHRAQR